MSMRLLRRYWLASGREGSKSPPRMGGFATVFNNPRLWRSVAEALSGS
jgi:hypothetical protein